MTFPWQFQIWCNINHSVKFASLNVICILGQFAIISSKNVAIILHGCLVALVKFDTCRTAVLMELANTIHLMIASIANIFHNFLSLFSVGHWSCFAFIRPNDIVINSRMIEHIRTCQKFIGFEQSVNLSWLSMWSISFLLNFVTLRII